MAIHLYTDIYSFTLIISYNETLYNVNNDEKSNKIMLILINIIVNILLVIDLIKAMRSVLDYAAILSYTLIL